MPDYLKSYAAVDSAGGIKKPDLEKINQIQPDLIIISGRQRDFQKDLGSNCTNDFSKCRQRKHLVIDR